MPQPAKALLVFFNGKSNAGGAERMVQYLEDWLLSRGLLCEIVDEEKLNAIAEVLGVSAEAIKNYSDETVLNVINNTFTSNDSSTINAINIQPNFNPLDKVVELYERLVQAEKDKVEYLEKIMKGK